MEFLRAKIFKKLRAPLSALTSFSTTNFSFPPPSPHSFHFCYTMSLLAINTVDRLDRPSAYYVGKVRCSLSSLGSQTLWPLGNTRRRLTLIKSTEQKAQI